MYLDLTPDDREQAVARLTELGASEGATHGDSEFRWTVCATLRATSLRDGLTNEHRGR